MLRTARSRVSEALISESALVKAPTRLGPSRFTAAQRCQLQAAWAADSQLRDPLPRFPVARVGTVVHSVLEVAAKGKFVDASESEFGRHWDRAVAKVEREMNLSWPDRHLVPLSTSDRLYEVRRFQAEEASLSLARYSSAQPPRYESGGSASGLGSELWVETADKRIGGFIDVVLLDGAILVLRDYKTGLVTELDNGGEVSIKEAYQDQLRIYAALYSETFGQWPGRLEVVTPVGETFIVEGEPTECLQLLDNAKALLDEIVELIEAAESNVEAQEVLASPSPAACGICSFRPLCIPYLRSAPGNGEDGWPLDVWGRCTDLAKGEDDTVAITLESSQGEELRIRGIQDDTARNPALAEATEGAIIAAFSLRPRQEAESFVSGAQSTIYRVVEPNTRSAMGFD